MCVGPDDCFEGDGESYRGFVSETDDGHDCLPWNSHLVRAEMNPDIGIGPHSYCRSDMTLGLSFILLSPLNLSTDISWTIFYSSRSLLHLFGVDFI